MKISTCYHAELIDSRPFTKMLASYIKSFSDSIEASQRLELLTQTVSLLPTINTSRIRGLWCIVPLIVFTGTKPTMKLEKSKVEILLHLHEMLKATSDVYNQRNYQAFPFLDQST